MSSQILDRLLTIAVTATLTSAAWIVAGSVYYADREPASAAAGRNSSGVADRPQAAGEDARMAASSGAGGEPAQALTIPVAGVSPGQITDTFTDERAGGERMHQALDILAPAGTPVVAAAPGTIERLFFSEAGGNTIYVRSADRRIIHYYAHLREYAPGLAEGQAVRRGQRLGSVGSSGNADSAAPHLHFAILRTDPEAKWWEPASAINPYRLLRGT